VSLYTYFHCNATQLPNTVRIRIWIRGTAGSSDKSVFNHGLVSATGVFFYLLSKPVLQIRIRMDAYDSGKPDLELHQKSEKQVAQCRRGNSKWSRGESVCVMVADLHHFKGTVA
jgi:hypothetical protein